MLLDSCHSGAAFQHHLVQQAAEHDGLYMLSATAADAAAYELDRLGNGVFTYVVQEGLEGKADRDSNSVVSFEELATYIGNNVRDLSSRHDIRMEPYVPILSQYLDFPLSDVKNLRRVFLQVTDSSSFGYQALPGRFAWWQKRIEEMDELSLSNLQDEFYRLSIVENAGEPSHSLLSTSDGTEISRWDFREISVEDMLQALVEKLSSHHRASAVCGSRGLTPNLECGQ